MARIPFFWFREIRLQITLSVYIEDQVQCIYALLLHTPWIDQDPLGGMVDLPWLKFVGFVFGQGYFKLTGIGIEIFHEIIRGVLAP